MDTFSMYIKSDEFEPAISQEEIEEVLRELYEEEMRTVSRWEDICG